MAQYAILVYVVFAALTQLGITVQLAAPTLLILPGGREVAQDIVQKAYNRSNELHAS